MTNVENLVRPKKHWMSIWFACIQTELVFLSSVWTQSDPLRGFQGMFLAYWGAKTIQPLFCWLKKIDHPNVYLFIQNAN